jgi:hypothetical protein
MNDQLALGMNDQTWGDSDEDWKVLRYLFEAGASAHGGKAHTEGMDGVVLILECDREAVAFRHEVTLECDREAVALDFWILPSSCKICHSRERFKAAASRPQSKSGLCPPST